MSTAILRAAPSVLPPNGIPWKAYAYNGDGTDRVTPPELRALLDAEPDLPDDPYREPGALQPCGTPAAYKRHQRRKEPVDAACALAEADRKAAIREAHAMRRSAA